MSSLNIDTWSTTPGSNNATPPNGAPEGMAFSTVNDTMRQIMAVVTSQVRSLPTAGGTANALTVTNAPALTTLVTGQLQVLNPASANTGAATFAPDGLTAKNIFAYGAALLGGELQPNVPALLKYDGTQWNLLNPNDASGSFTLTLTGVTASGTVNWRIVAGKTVYITIPSAIAGTSTSTAMTGTGVPSALVATTNKAVLCPLTDNSAGVYGNVHNLNSTTWVFGNAVGNVAMTNGNTKGLGNGSNGNEFSYTKD